MSKKFHLLVLKLKTGSYEILDYKETPYSHRDIRALGKKFIKDKDVEKVESCDYKRFFSSVADMKEYFLKS